MARWFINAISAGKGRSAVDSESRRASSKASDARRRFDYAKRERDLDKKLSYLAEGLSSLAASLEHVSNTTPPIANVAFASSLLAKDLGNALEEQTKDIVKELKS